MDADGDSDGRFETRAIHAGYEPDGTGAVMPPIHLSTTFARRSPDSRERYAYARGDNPTRATLEANVAALEGGAHARCFASGMGAIDAVLHLLSAGDRVVTAPDVYGGTHYILQSVYEDFGVEVDFVDTTDLDAVREAMTPETKLLWLESPTNPLLRINDLEALAGIAAEYGAHSVVDNTFATPYLQRPLALGADVVVHSLTKYLGGHSDVMAGAVVTDDPALDERIAGYQTALGATPSPFDCFLVLRGTKTLAPRMDRHCRNAGELAGWLADRPAVERVYYPGLAGHPDRDLAAEQMADFGGVLSVEFDATAEEAGAIAASTEVFTLAGSLGGVESLIGQPATMSHATVPREDRLAAGITDGLLRLSVGIEHVDDLRADLDRAIDAILG